MNLTGIAAMQMEDIDHIDNKFDFVIVLDAYCSWDDLNEWRKKCKRDGISYMRRVGWRPDRRRHRRGDAVCNHRLPIAGFAG